MLKYPRDVLPGINRGEGGRREEDEDGPLRDVFSRFEQGEGVKRGV